jgi:histidine triad (HIT) family protein
LKAAGNPCPLCAIGSGADDADLVAFRTPYVFVVLTRKQRRSNPGQVLVCPVSHEVSFHRLQERLRNELFDVAAAVAGAVHRAFGALGTTVLVNDKAPDQTLEHVHIHIIPRFAGDDLVIPNLDSAAAPRSFRLELASKLRTAMQ